MMFGKFEGAVRRGRGGNEKEWTDCVRSDVRAFGIVGDWEAMALDAEVWVQAVTEVGRMFMAGRRKEEVDAARHRQEKRERESKRDWESCYPTPRRRTCEATPIGLVDEPKESYTGARRTET